MTSLNWAPIFRLRNDKPGMQLTKFTLGPHLQGYPKNDRVQKYPKNDRVQQVGKSKIRLKNDRVQNLVYKLTSLNWAPNFRLRNDRVQIRYAN